MHTPQPIARLALADGSLFRGVGFGAGGTTATGEVVFNTAMTGYQESLTDPSYAGQILVQTAPMVGNTGVNAEDVESGRVQVAGLVVHELARRHSNYRAEGSLGLYLDEAGVPGLAGIDTRALTRLIRAHGVLGGAISSDESVSDAALAELARAAQPMTGQNLAAVVGCSCEGGWNEGLGSWGKDVGKDPLRHALRDTSPARGGGSGRGKTPSVSLREPPPPHAGEGVGLRVLALDCGAKRNIFRHLTTRGCVVRVVPHDTAGEQVVAMWELGDIDGLFVSNGPGDPGAVVRTIGSLREVLGAPSAKGMPVFGICLGHQLLALALGATTYKLKFGHRGANQPVRDEARGRVEITSQNHGFAVDAQSLVNAGGRVTHTHLNDSTVAGFDVPGRAVCGVQFHPEASPGPHDATGLFDRFVERMWAARSGRSDGLSG